MSQPPLDGPVAVLGFGNQGEAQALNLRDSGCDVLVGARPGGGGESRARAHGFSVVAIGEAARRARVIAVLLPDEAVPSLWSELRASATAGAAFVFAHGFSLLYGG